jgi:hypothetical protein
MKSILDRYLDRVLLYANKPDSGSEAIRQELKDHLLQKVDDLIADGLPKEEALLEALRQHGPPRVIGYRLRGPFPWIDIRSHGTARGVIAIGPRAVGIFAFGGWAMGVFACGGFSLGLFSFGGFALGLLFAFGGFGIGGIVSAGFACGLVAAGGVAIGLVAVGNPGIGLWVPHGWHHGGVISHYTAANVPPVLKSLEPLLNTAVLINRYILIIMPVYMLSVAALCFLQIREGKRVSSGGDDWLLDD